MFVTNLGLCEAIRSTVAVHIRAEDTPVTAPASSGSVPDQSFTEGVAIDALPLAGYFTGNRLVFSAAGLPEGLSVDSVSGVLSGTPVTVQGATDATITATNSAGSADQPVSVSVVVAAPAASGTPDPQVYTQNTATAPLAMSGYFSGTVESYSATGLPTGLSIDTATGEITGTPTTPQAATDATITATNAAGSANQTVSFEVVAAVIAPTDITLSASSVAENAGTGSTVATLSTDGTGTVTYSIVVDADGKFEIYGSNLNLKAGLDYETAASHDVTIRVTNSAGSFDKAFTITVTNVVDVAPVASGSVPGQTYTQNAVIGTLAMAGYFTAGDGAHTYSATGLPDGLSINSTTGDITGTPTTPQAATNATITATNAAGSANQTVSITVEAAAAGTLWTPAELTSAPALWLDASDASTMTDAGSGAVSQWSDKSGNLNHAVQATASRQPVHSNGRLVYDGADRWLDLTASLSGNLEIFMVSKWADYTGDYRVVLGHSSAYDFHGGANGAVLSTNASTAVRDNFYLDTVHAPFSDLAASNSRWLVDTLVNVRAAASTQVSRISMDRTKTGRAFKGDICEIVIFSANISAGDREKMEGYLANKWGTTLPAGHAYASAAPTV